MGTICPMTSIRNRSVAALLALSAVSLAACGSSSKSGSTAGGSGNAGALSAEAKSAATGDIPDNQNFIVFKSSGAGYSIKYPEGWAQTGSGRDVSIRDKNNIVHIVVTAGSQPTPATVTGALNKQRAGTPSLKAGTPTAVALKGAGRAVKVTYTTVSPPNPVTGKRVKLTVDRYVVAKGGKVATIDLGTPLGVDNVDAYRLMAQSFQWR
jgi:hypothetical protein